MLKGNRLIVHGPRSIAHTQGRRKLWTMDYRLSTISHTLIMLMFIFSALGCTSDSTLIDPPPQLLSKQQMTSFLIDLHLAEAKMNYIEMRKTDSLEIIFRNYEKYLMTQHGFTDSVYLKSYEYYLDHMELMDEIYSDVVDSLSVMNSRQKALELEKVDDNV